MLHDEKMIGLLVEWEDRRQLGREQTAEELCGDSPELVTIVQEGINALKGSDWLLEDDEEDDGFLPLPNAAAVRPPNAELPTSTLSVDEFSQAVAESGLLSTDEVESLRTRSVAQDAQSLAGEFVSEERLTRYQASVLLEKRSDPLLLDKYIILDMLESGGMGVVFKALHRTMDRVVALKILPPTVVDSSSKIKRFQREVKAAAKLAHPHIVHAYDADDAQGTYFLVMEYVKGRDLSKVVKADGPLAVSTAVDYILQAARGLEHAHRQGIIHRDIKPANLLLDTEGTVKVLDMGLARFDAAEGADEQAASQDLTEAGAVMGTVAFMSPEQAADTSSADHRSDIYSLGCTLFCLLSGRAPYSESTPVKTLLAHRDQAVPSLCDERDDIPEYLNGVYSRMMAKKPEERYQSMTEVIAALKACTAGVKEDSATELISAAPLPARSPVDQRKTVVAKPLESGGRTGRRSWSGIVASIALVGMLALYLSGTIFSIKTDSGTLEIAVNVPDAVVEIDGEQAKVTYSKDRKTLTISVDPGTHKLVVRTPDGTQLKTDSGRITIDAGGKQTITARLIRTVPDNPGKNTAGRAEPSINGQALWRPTVAQRTLIESIAKLSAKKQVAVVREALLATDPEYKDLELTESIEDDKLVGLKVNAWWLRDITALAALHDLRQLDLSATAVVDLRPVAKAPLVEISAPVSTYNETAAAIFRSLPTLKRVNGITTAEFLGRREEIESLRQELAKAPAPEQLVLVVAKLREYNPEFKENVGHTIEEGRIIKLVWYSDHVSELAPVRLLPELQELVGAVTVRPTVRSLADLSPLKGLALQRLNCEWTGVSDLSPLTGAELVFCDLNNTLVSDLSPLRGVPLEELNLTNLDQLSDLSPLQGMPLKTLDLKSCSVANDLSALAGLPLEYLNCHLTAVRSLSPLAGMPLRFLDFGGSGTSDLTPLRGMPLETLHIQVCEKLKDLSPLRGMPLENLRFDRCPNLHDLSPLQGMPIKTFQMNGSSVSDFSPIRGCPLVRVNIDFRLFHQPDESLLRSFDGLDMIASNTHELNGRNTADQFWQKVETVRRENEEFVKSTADLSAKERLEAVRQRLDQLERPNATGRIKNARIVDDKVKEIEFSVYQSATLAPLRALTSLRKLTIHGYATVRDLSPLNTLPLEEIECEQESLLRANADVFRGMKTLKRINGKPLEEFLKTPTRSSK